MYKCTKFEWHHDGLFCLFNISCSTVRLFDKLVFRCDDSIHIPQAGEHPEDDLCRLCLITSGQNPSPWKRSGFPGSWGLALLHTCTRPVRWKQMVCTVGGNILVRIPHQYACTAGNQIRGEPHPKMDQPVLLEGCLPGTAGARVEVDCTYVTTEWRQLITISVKENRQICIKYGGII